jgi:hypothetical protein
MKKLMLTTMMLGSFGSYAASDCSVGLILNPPFHVDRRGVYLEMYPKVESYLKDELGYDVVNGSVVDPDQYVYKINLDLLKKNIFGRWRASSFIFQRSQPNNFRWKLLAKIDNNPLEDVLEFIPKCVELKEGKI